MTNTYQYPVLCRVNCHKPATARVTADIRYQQLEVVRQSNPKHHHSDFVNDPRRHRQRAQRTTELVGADGHDTLVPVGPSHNSDLEDRCASPLTEERIDDQCGHRLQLRVDELDRMSERPCTLLQKSAPTYRVLKLQVGTVQEWLDFLRVHFAQRFKVRERSSGLE